MSPGGRHLRNRKKIKAPRRFDDENITTSPRQESLEESEESSELEEEVYQSPKPKKPKAKPRAYHGEVIEFNPNLPPAAFPTLDHPSYVHNGGNLAIDLKSHLSGLQSRKSRLAEFEAIDPDLVDRGCHREEVDLKGARPTMTSTTADFTRPASQSVMQTSITAQKRPGASMPSSLYGEPTDNGPRNTTWASNMALMEEAGRMSELDRNILEMESSDEEDAAAREVSTKLARAASTPGYPAWDGLTIAHKLDLADTVAELHQLYEDPAQVMGHLRLSHAQGEELIELLIQRQGRAAREKTSQQRLQEQTKDLLLQGRPLLQSRFHQMVEDNLYQTINEHDHLQTNLMELKKARAYLRYCGFDPRLAASSWDVPSQPSMSNTARGTKARPAQSKPPASLSSTAAQLSPSPLKGPFSRRPSPSTPSQQVSYAPDHRLESVQQRTQAARPQHRPVPTHALIAQHSPAAHLSKVPVQSYRVGPGNQSGARPQRTTRIPQPTLPASPAKPNALLKARGGSSVLPTPQDQPSVPEDSHSLAHRGPDIQHARNVITKAVRFPMYEISTPQGTGDAVKNGDSVNKERRKKSAT